MVVLKIVYSMLNYTWILIAPRLMSLKDIFPKNRQQIQDKIKLLNIIIWCYRNEIVLKKKHKLQTRIRKVGEKAKNQFVMRRFAACESILNEKFASNNILEKHEKTGNYFDESIWNQHYVTNINELHLIIGMFWLEAAEKLSFLPLKWLFIFIRKKIPTSFVKNIVLWCLMPLKMQLSDVCKCKLPFTYGYWMERAVPLFFHSHLVCFKGSHSQSFSTVLQRFNNNGNIHLYTSMYTWTFSFHISWQRKRKMEREKEEERDKIVHIKLRLLAMFHDLERDYASKNLASMLWTVNQCIK